MNSVFEKYSKRYDAWYDRNKFAYLSELRALRNAVPEYGKGLEVGVGTGRFAYPLGISIGIDPSYDLIKIASLRGVTARWVFGEDIPFLSNSFDYAAIIVALSFVNDPLKVLKEIRRVLKSSGRIIVGMVDKDSFLGELYQSKESAFYKEANLFTVREVTSFLKHTGFGQFFYYQTIFKPPNIMDSVEEPLSGFGKGAFVVISAQKERV